ncbi:unnamed protein product [Danaus chrysippus]|uniref:(African queen) hypothetical protein n=1 Tax=Danaus chrysippus TaxID=151541 RepID=A0A8J2QH81_9NEOP|nr:unnamed protein product [Danaus chrysippus]
MSSLDGKMSRRERVLILARRAGLCSCVFKAPCEGNYVYSSWERMNPKRLRSLNIRERKGMVLFSSGKVYPPRKFI